MTRLGVRVTARLVDALLAPLIHGPRAWRTITRPRCPLCREHTNRLEAHLYVNHFGEQAHP